MFPKKKQNRFQLSFKTKEVPVYMPMEEFLMDDLDIPTRERYIQDRTQEPL